MDWRMNMSSASLSSSRVSCVGRSSQRIHALLNWTPTKGVFDTSYRPKWEWIWLKLMPNGCLLLKWLRESLRDLQILKLSRFTVSFFVQMYIYWLNFDVACMRYSHWTTESFLLHPAHLSLPSFHCLTTQLAIFFPKFRGFGFTWNLLISFLIASLGGLVSCRVIDPWLGRLINMKVHNQISVTQKRLAIYSLSAYSGQVSANNLAKCLLSKIGKLSQSVLIDI